MWIAVIYFWSINLLVLLAFGWDKLRARRRRRRIREKTLIWLAILGGAAGALLGRWIFHHKTRNRGFSVTLICIFLTQIGAFYLFASNKVMVPM